MMHPETVAILQEQQRIRIHKSPPSDDDGTADKRSFSQRLWGIVREALLATPHHKVRSASYCPPSAERPRSNKRRARSCGHAADGRDHHHHSQHYHHHHHHRDGSSCMATGTADAWRKSRMLQELEASTVGGGTSAMPTTAVLRRCMETHEHDLQDALHAPRSAGWSRLAAQRTCRNCGQLFFTRNVEPRVAAAFCSLDCKSSFEYLRCVQHVVDEHIDEEVTVMNAAATHTACPAEHTSS